VILIGLGGNLNSDAGEPLATMRAALAMMSEMNIDVRAVSPWYRSAPWPTSDQPWFVNGVAEIATSLSPHHLLVQLHEIEARFGRVRTMPNAARTLDLDLLAHGDEILSGVVSLPHPRLQERDFVLAPLADLAPDWRHPVLGKSARELLLGLPPGGGLVRLP
jgi:2-amino-4-hydroxy-6-hydroxymethyldihydropteridine diphosphokinase